MCGLIGKLKSLFARKEKTRENSEKEEMKKFLIVGLGNIGTEYEGTRHNLGFMTVDTLAYEKGVSFKGCRYGEMATVKEKNCQLLLLKPGTFMNLSGNAVKYWIDKEALPIDHLLVVVDDLALPFGEIRIREKGSDAGHNGLKDIAAKLGTQSYPRLRFGIGNDFNKGEQIEYVLSKFTPEQRKELPEKLDHAVEAIKAFCLSGASFAMTHFNN